MSKRVNTAETITLWIRSATEGPFDTSHEDACAALKTRLRNSRKAGIGQTDIRRIVVAGLSSADAIRRLQAEDVDVWTSAPVACPSCGGGYCAACSAIHPRGGLTTAPAVIETTTP